MYIAVAIILTLLILRYRYEIVCYVLLFGIKLWKWLDEPLIKEETK